MSDYDDQHYTGYEDGLRQGADEAADTIARLTRERDEAVAMLRTLTDEVDSIWRVFEPALRLDISNTNYQIMADKIMDARVALARIDGAPT